MSYLSIRLKTLFQPLPEALQAVPEREQRIYLIYGVTSFVFTVWLLLYIASFFADFLITEFQAWGFLVFVGLLACFFWRRLKMWFAALLGTQDKAEAQ